MSANPQMANDFPACDTPGAPSQLAVREYSPRYVGYVVFLLALVNVFNTMDKLALSVLLPDIKADLRLSDGQIGLAFGFAYSVFYSLCGFPIAWWADRGNRRNIIALALAAWSLMTALSGAVQNFWQLFVARVGVGVGDAGGIPPSASMICDYVPQQQRPGAFSIYNFGLFVGMTLGLVLAGWLGENIGWRWTFVALGLPGIALAVIVRFTLQEPTRGRFEAAHSDRINAPWAETFGFLWRCRTYRQLVFFLALNGMVSSALNLWWPSFYTRMFGLGLSSVGIQLGLAIGIGASLALLLVGLMGNRLARRDARLPLLIGVGAVILSLPTVLASLFVSPASISMLLVAVTMFLYGLTVGPIAAVLYGVVMPRMRATAAIVAMLATYLVGGTVGPVGVGILSDFLTPLFGVEALRYALLAPLCLYPIMAISLYVSTKELLSDLRAIGAHK